LRHRDRVPKLVARADPTVRIGSRNRQLLNISNRLIKEVCDHDVLAADESRSELDSATGPLA